MTKVQPLLLCSRILASSVTYQDGPKSRDEDFGGNGLRHTLRQSQIKKGRAW